MTQQHAQRSQIHRNHPDAVAWETTFAYKLGLPRRVLSALRRAFFARVTDGSRRDLERIIAEKLLVKRIGPVGIATLRECLARYDVLQNGDNRPTKAETP